jgi:hypothetical protein
MEGCMPDEDVCFFLFGGHQSRDPRLGVLVDLV